MKKILTAIVSVLSWHSMEAQGFLGGFFNQSGTQESYYLQQIAALATYEKYLQGGYNTINKGITTIHQIKSDEYDLHQGYFNSLSAVSPAVANDPKIAGILSYQADINKA